MIRMAGEDGRGAVDLLGEDAAGEPMRQGHGTERQDEISLEQRREAETVGAADQEGKPLCAAVAKSRQGLREGLTSQLRAASIESDHFVRGRPLDEKGLSFGLHARLRSCPLGFGNFNHIEGR